MGRKVPKSLADACHYGLNILLLCRCGRRDVFNCRQMWKWVQVHRWYGGMSNQVLRFRCRCGADLKDWGFAREDANVDLAAIAEAQAVKMEGRAAFYRSIYARPARQIVELPATATLRGH